jgi:dimethylhistidine N-methyltransferase
MNETKLIDLSPNLATLAEEVVAGLSASPKRLPCKLLYDERGSQLFDEICWLEEYYPTRTEVSILREHGPDMARLLGPRRLIVEYGSGSGLKTRMLLDALEDPAGYVPIDISREALLDSCEHLRVRYPDLAIVPVCADYTSEFRLPPEEMPRGRKAVFFPGSTIGNFERDEALAFLRRIARVVGPGGALLIGVDVKKDPAVLQRAYDDARGVTAAFNLNLLTRMNRELEADFDLSTFAHRAVYDERRGRIEMHLVSRRPQTVHVNGDSFSFDEGETIWTENSYKYALDEFRDLANEAGFDVTRVWQDEKRLFSVQLLNAV